MIALVALVTSLWVLFSLIGWTVLSICVGMGEDENGNAPKPLSRLYFFHPLAAVVGAYLFWQNGWAVLKAMTTHYSNH